MAKQGRGSEQAMIRLPDGMRDQLKDEAEKNGRSMNAEIVERLTYSIEHPPSERAKLLAFVQELDAELDEAHLKIDDLIRHGNMLNMINDQNSDYQRRILYHVLNYIEEIPVELSIWVSDIIAALEREELMTEILRGSEGDEREIKRKLIERREGHRRKALQALRDHLAERKEAEGNVSPET